MVITDEKGKTPNDGKSKENDKTNVVDSAENSSKPSVESETREAVVAGTYDYGAASNDCRKVSFRIAIDVYLSGELNEEQHSALKRAKGDSRYFGYICREYLEQKCADSGGVLMIDLVGFYSENADKIVETITELSGRVPQISGADVEKMLRA